MPNSSKFDGDFYDADYFENGKVSGKGWLMNYKWMPRRSFKEAFAYIDHLGLDHTSHVLDVGCAKGFIVRALRELEIKADGCDISKYALSFAPEGCWNSDNDEAWRQRADVNYTHVLIKDVLEHLTEKQLYGMLSKISQVTSRIMCVIPMGDNGVYRIREYHTEVSHLIAENEKWWQKAFAKAGWHVIKACPHVPGLKDNWQNRADGRGNHVFVLEKKIRTKTVKKAKAKPQAKAKIKTKAKIKAKTIGKD